MINTTMTMNGHNNSVKSPKRNNNNIKFILPDEEEESKKSLYLIIKNCITLSLAAVCVMGLVILLLLLYTCIRPFSRKFYRRLAATIAISSFLDALALILPNIRICLTEDSDIISTIGASVLVCNHSHVHNYLDWWVLMMLGRCIHLRGSIKLFLKEDQLHRDFFIFKQLIRLLEYPLLPSSRDYVGDRAGLFELLRGFAQESCDTTTSTTGVMSGCNPVHLLLFPECFANNVNMAEFARREGRPQLKHLFLPRTTGFNASLESLRSANPSIYDISLAFKGCLDLQVKETSSTTQALIFLQTFYNLCTGQIPEIHLKIKKHTLENVLQDSQWLDKCWAEKDRQLIFFQRHQSFVSSRARLRIFDTKYHSVENSIIGFFRLVLMIVLMPVILLFSIPLAWTVGWLWLSYQAFQLLVLYDSPKHGGGGLFGLSSSNCESTNGNSGTSTPFIPATPFVSPATMAQQ